MLEELCCTIYEPPKYLYKSKLTKGMYFNQFCPPAKNVASIVIIYINTEMITAPACDLNSVDIAKAMRTNKNTFNHNDIK